MNIHTVGLVNLAYLLLAPLAFTLGTGALLWSWRNRLPARSWQVALAMACALIVAGNFLGVFSTQPQREKLHKVQYGEIYHYYLGSKYYTELKNTELYRCTWLGFQELDASGHEIPHPEIVRNLAVTWEKEDLNALGDHVNTRCNNLFTEKRWAEFLADLGVFLKVYNDTPKWHRIMVDYGNNPPPTWNVMAGAAANLIPLTPTTLNSLIWIDLGLVLLLIPLVIWRVFGLFPAIGYVLLAGMQPMLPPGMDGAAFFRQIWLVTLTLGICALHARKFATAGVLLGFSTAIRVFPGVFAVGAALPLLWSWRDHGSRRAFIRLAAGLCASGGTMLVLSLILYGPEHWRSFVMVIDSHANNLAANAIGFKRHLLSFLYTHENVLTLVDATRFTGGQVWFQYLKTNIEDFRTYFTVYTGAMLLMTVAVAVRLRPTEAALIFGTVCMFFLTSAYGYYYVFLPLFAVVWLTDGFDRRPMTLLLWIIGVFLIIAWYFPFKYAYLTDYYTAASNVMFAVLTGMVTTAFWFLYRVEIGQMVSARKFRPLHLILLAASVSLVMGGVYTLVQA